MDDKKNIIILVSSVIVSAVMGIFIGGSLGIVLFVSSLIGILIGYLLKVWDIGPGIYLGIFISFYVALETNNLFLMALTYIGIVFIYALIIKFAYHGADKLGDKIDEKLDKRAKEKQSEKKDNIESLSDIYSDK